MVNIDRMKRLLSEEDLLGWPTTTKQFQKRALVQHDVLPTVPICVLFLHGSQRRTHYFSVTILNSVSAASGEEICVTETVTSQSLQIRWLKKESRTTHQNTRLKSAFISEKVGRELPKTPVQNLVEQKVFSYQVGTKFSFINFGEIFICLLFSFHFYSKLYVKKV